MVPSSIDVVRIVASAFGYECDIEPMEPGKYRLTASKGGATIRLNGASLEDVSLKLIETLTPETK